MLTQEQLSHRFTLEEYLNYSQVDSERTYELENGHLKEIRGIEHYWIVDPKEQKFVHLQLQDGLYEAETYNSKNEDICLKQPFPLNLKLSQMF